MPFELKLIGFFNKVYVLIFFYFKWVYVIWHYIVYSSFKQLIGVENLKSFTILGQQNATCSFHFAPLVTFCTSILENCVHYSWNKKDQSTNMGVFWDRVHMLAL